MLKLIVTVGISNSGKTKWAEKFVQDNLNFVNINRDDIREELFCKIGRLSQYRMTKAKEKEVTRVQEKMMKLAVEYPENFSVIISDTNLNPKTRKKLKKFANTHKMEYIEKVFDTSLHLCKRRNIKRGYTLPPSVLERQEVAMRNYLGKTPYTGTNGKPDTIIVDVDGTVADMSGIRTAFQWAKVSEDKPRHSIVSLVNLLSTNNKIIFLSGRDGVCYKDTFYWLQNLFSFPITLFMRTPNDMRLDSVIKEEIFWKSIANSYNVLYCIDDRNQVVDLWRSMGIECIQVASGDF
jgi:predicted kinase